MASKQKKYTYLELHKMSFEQLNKIRAQLLEEIAQTEEAKNVAISNIIGLQHMLKEKQK